MSRWIFKRDIVGTQVYECTECGLHLCAGIGDVQEDEVCPNCGGEDYDDEDGYTSDDDFDDAWGTA